MTDVAADTTWEGADALRPFLVPIAELEPFPGNPRRGDVARIRESIRRFGQVKGITVDGSRIVAGHHFVLAAAEEGFSHVAAIPNTFGDEDEQRAFLVADNRSSDAGTYELELLAEQLTLISERSTLEGTGYTKDDLDEQLAEIERMNRVEPTPLLPAAPAPPTEPLDFVEFPVVLRSDRRETFELWLEIVSRERKTNGVSDTIYEAVRLAALSLHQSV